MQPTEPNEDRELVVQQQTKALASSKRDIRSLVEGPEFRAAVKAALPRAMRPERFVRVALNALMRQPDLLKCTPESFFKAMLDLSMYGIEPDGRRAHLIPFRNNKTNCMEVQLIIDYKGLAELIRRSGDVSFIHADIVYPSDDFEFSFGSAALLRHRPNFDRPEDEKPKCVYSFVRLKDGTEDFVVMSIAEVNKIRKRSKAATSGPWVTDYDEMAKKTVFRRHSKWLPLSPEVRDAVERDDSDVIDASGLAITEREQGTITTASLHPSADENRGHDATQPADRDTQNDEKGSGKDGGEVATGSATGETDTRQGTGTSPVKSRPAAAAVQQDEPPANILKISDWDSLVTSPEWVEVDGVVYRAQDDGGNYKKWETPTSKGKTQQGFGFQRRSRQ